MLDWKNREREKHINKRTYVQDRHFFFIWKIQYFIKYSLSLRLGFLNPGLKCLDSRLRSFNLKRGYCEIIKHVRVLNQKILKPIDS